jgi:hypothetical protein
MKERNQSCQKMGIQGFKMKRIMKKWIQERLWFGDADATIWGGLDGVVDSGTKYVHIMSIYSKGPIHSFAMVK